MLKALMEYGKNLDSEPGFKTREIRWCIELNINGRFIGVLPLGDSRSGTLQPRCPEMHNMNAGGKAHFLLETAQTVVKLHKPKEKRKNIKSTHKKHEFFVQILSDGAKAIPALKPLEKVVKNKADLREIRKALKTHKAKSSDWLGWRVESSDPREDHTVQDWWREWRKTDMRDPLEDKATGKKKNERKMICFLTGNAITPLSTHSKISGLSQVGGLPMGDVMVGFDKAAFTSFGLDQSANAAMGAEATQRYVDGLNELIRNHSQKLINTLSVHWFKEQVAPKDDPLEWLNGFESQEQTESAALAAASRLLNSIRSGERSDLGNNRFYALTLSGAAGRVMVRDWMEGRFEDLVRNIKAWFNELAIIARDGKKQAHDPKFMAVCGALVRKLADLPASTTSTLWKVAVKRLPIPQPLMAQALAQIRMDLVNKDQPPFNHARMGLIKAYFIRLQPGGDLTMTANLNPNHPEAAYHCGRLLAVFSNLQHAALGEVGVGVVQRYYVAASQTPGLILGRLTSNAQNHLSKLEGGLAHWYENQIAAVMSQLDDGAPRLLDLNGQGLFALGYYQQLASLRSGKSPSDMSKGESE